MIDNKKVEENNGWVTIRDKSDLPTFKNILYNCFCDEVISRRIDGFVSITNLKDVTHDNHSHYCYIEKPTKVIKDLDEYEIRRFNEL